MNIATLLTILALTTGEQKDTLVQQQPHKPHELLHRCGGCEWRDLVCKECLYGGELWGDVGVLVI